jgi:LmbE family N-acetylglucosaminyl deacetylase
MFATRSAWIGLVPIWVGRELPRRLLGVWAHPDDEAYLSAGLMARVVDSGGEVTVVTATRGEQGTADPERLGTAAFAAHREMELRASLAELGVGEVRVLDLPDGGCDRIDPTPSIARIATLIDDLGPDAIVTFGPDGITGHPDHRAVSRWTTEAWRRTGASAELLYAAMTDGFAARNRALHERLGLFDDYGDDVPASVPNWAVALECSLTTQELARKRRALARHASQTVELADMVGDAEFTNWWRDETFRHPTRSEILRPDAAPGSSSIRQSQGRSRMVGASS